MKTYIIWGVSTLCIICLVDLCLPKTRRVNRNLYGFFLMEGRLKLPGFLAAILSANLSIGNFLIFIASWGYMFGWGGIFWFLVNLLLNTVAYIIFIPTFRSYIEDKNNSGTIHEYLSCSFANELEDKSFNTKIRLVASATTILGLLFAIVFEIHLAATLLAPLLGVDTILFFTVLTIIICIYSGIGGFHTLVFTDVIQSLFMFIGTAAVIPILLSLGTKDQLFKSYPIEFNSLLIGWPSVLGICIIGSGWFLVAMDQWQRTCATRDSKRTKKGMIWYFISISVFAIIYGLMGMVDHASILPSLNPAIASLHTGSNNPLINYFIIAQNSSLISRIDQICYALTGIALLAAAMSTANTFLIVSGHSFISDLLLAVSKHTDIHSLTDKQNRIFVIIARSSIIGMGVFIIFTWVILNIFGLLKDPLSFFFIAYSIQFALLAPMVFSCLRNRFRIPARSVFNSIWLSVLISLVFGVWFWILSQQNIPSVLGLNPVDWLSLTPVIAFLVGILNLLIGIRRRPKNATAADNI